MGLHGGSFRSDDLERVDTSKCVVLNSGGPLMDIECVEGDNALCSWWSESGTQQHLFPVACLSSLVPYVPTAEQAGDRSDD